MQYKDIDSLVDSLVGGNIDLDDVIKGMVYSKSDIPTKERVVRCTNSLECDFEITGGADGHTDVCPRCGAAMVEATITTYGDKNSHNPVVRQSSYSVIETNDSNPIRQYTLAYLRPGDSFIFLSTLPSGASKNVNYHIISARRGYVTFTNEFNKPITVPLCRALLCEVKLLNRESVDSGRRFVRGDRVREVSTNRRGVLTEIKGGSSYAVRFDDNNDKLEVVQGSHIQLINKDKTTKSYITSDNGGGRFIVEFGDFREGCDSFSEALKILCKSNRAAFNRYSKMLVEKPGSVSREDIELLIKLDPRVWGIMDNLLKHNFIDSKEEYEDVRQKFDLQ